MSATSILAGASRTQRQSPTLSVISKNNDPVRLYTRWQRSEYPKRMWYCIAGGIALFVVANIFSMIRERYRKKRLLAAIAQPSSAIPANTRTGPISWRRVPNYIEAAFKLSAFRRTISLGRYYEISVAELLTGVVYTTALYTWGFVNSDGGNKRYWYLRIGSMAVTQLPLLVLLAGKNNIISLLTGLSFDKVSFLHRVVARVVFVMVLTHALSQAPITPDKLRQNRVRMGPVAGSAFAILMLFSIRQVRRKYFEVFLMVHMLMTVIIIVALYYHLPGEGEPMVAASAFWASDRVLRWIKLLFINTGKSIPVKVVPERISENAIRLTLPNRRIWWSPGQHVFLTLPGVSKMPFESHPFTITSIGNERRRELVFAIRTLDGFTRRLHDYMLENPGKLVTVLVDGPYGTPPPVNSFSNIVLLAGGSGVSVALPLLLSVISAVRKGQSPVRRVLFVWAIKTRDEIQWIAPELKEALKDVPSTLSLDLRFHITRANGIVPALTKTNPEITEKDDAVIEKIDEKTEAFTSTEKVVPVSPNESKGIKISLGRPDLTTIVREEIECATGPVSVNVSGPLRFTNTIRHVLQGDFAGPSAALRGAQPISLYVENFGTT